MTYTTYICLFNLSSELGKLLYLTAQDGRGLGKKSFFQTFKTGFFDYSMKYRRSAGRKAVARIRRSSFPNPRTLLIEIMIFVFAHETSTIIVCAISILARLSFFPPTLPPVDPFLLNCFRCTRRHSRSEIINAPSPADRVC